MREQIQRLLHTRPFKGFAIEVDSDLAYSIPTADHVLLASKAIVIEDDSGWVDIVPYSAIRRIRAQQEVE